MVPLLTAFTAVGFAGAINGHQATREWANLPVLDQQTFADSQARFQQLLSKNGRETDLVRVRVKQISDEATICRNREHVECASVLGEFSPGREVLIVATHYAYGGYPHLLAKAASNRGKQIEVVGKLRAWPSKLLEEDGKVYCGAEDLPPPERERWVLEMHEPDN